MRIAIFQTGPLAPGGTEYVVHNTANQLAAAGNEVIVFVGKPFFKSTPNAVYELHPHLYRVHQFICPIVKGLSRPWAQWNLIKVVKKTGCDIVHAHTLHTSANVAVHARRFMGVPVLVTGHGEDIQIDRELGYGYRLKKRHDVAVRFALRNADGATAITSAMAAEMLNAEAHNDRLWVVPNGISPLPLLKVEQLDKETRPYIFAMGRLIPKKGFEVLVRAFADVWQSGEKNCDLLIAGEGPEKVRLQSLARELGISSCVHFTGYLDESQKAKTLTGARMFICPSLREPFGIVNLEAMASSLAVIASDVDGITDLIEHGRNGLLFPPGKKTVLAKHILTLLRDPELARNMGTAGRSKAEAYTWPKITNMYMRIYMKIINEFKQKKGRQN
jgi:glycosyltransferase involved in cell wall biosynthesis